MNIVYVLFEILVEKNTELFFYSMCVSLIIISIFWLLFLTFLSLLHPPAISTTFCIPLSLLPVSPYAILPTESRSATSVVTAGTPDGDCPGGREGGGGGGEDKQAKEGAAKQATEAQVVRPHGQHEHAGAGAWLGLGRRHQTPQSAWQGRRAVLMVDGSVADRWSWWQMGSLDG